MLKALRMLRVPYIFLKMKLFTLGFQNGGLGSSGCLFSYFECCPLLVTAAAACTMRTVSLLGSEEWGLSVWFDAVCLGRALNVLCLHHGIWAAPNSSSQINISMLAQHCAPWASPYLTADTVLLSLHLVLGISLPCADLKTWCRFAWLRPHLHDTMLGVGRPGFCMCFCV